MGDITYIPTGEGWLYLAVVKDLCSRKIVGYAFSSRIDTALTLEALDIAVRRCKPSKGLIFHSGRGVQYAAVAFRERLESYGIRQRMRRINEFRLCAVFIRNISGCLSNWPTKAGRR